MDKSIEVYGNLVIDEGGIDGVTEEFPIQLEYYKICNKQKEQANEKPYGIGVVKTHTDVKEVNIEKREFNNIFSNEKDANNMLNLLMKHQVTPVSLRDVLEDYILV